MRIPTKFVQNKWIYNKYPDLVSKFQMVVRENKTKHIVKQHCNEIAEKETQVLI